MGPGTSNQTELRNEQKHNIRQSRSKVLFCFLFFYPSFYFIW